MLQLSLLGYPTVSHDGIPITDFISQKSLVLLCYLALEARTHSREVLAGLFWSEMPQERALSNLRQALHNLQKLTPDYLLITRQTVQFDASRPFHIDVMLFDEAAEDVIAAYRDVFMAGVIIAEAEDLDHWISRQREHYRLHYGQCVEQHIAACLAQREMLRVEALAHRLIAHDPYRETAYHALWRALVSQGHLNQALLSVENLRQSLRRDLATDLHPETQQIVERLTLAQTAVRHNIPTASSKFVGRETDIAQIRQHLNQAECRLVTVLGVGGVGKSRLAQEIGRLEADDYLNGVRYVPLGALTNSISLVSALADALDISLQNANQPQRKIETFLAEREMLLIFDNAEHLPEFAIWLAGLMTAVPDMKALVTSRHQLGLREEWVMPLEGLPFGSEDTSSVQLLIQTAAQQGQTVRQDADAATLCTVLEGLPLGIELAGAMLTGSASPLLQQIRITLDSLQARWINTEPRHQSLRAVFLTSWQMLQPIEQSALAKLALFRGSFTTDAAAYIADADETLLHRLRARSLVRAERLRWSLHTVIRTYASEFQVETDGLTARFETFYLSLLEQAETLFAARDVAKAVEVMRLEIENVRHCWQNALDHRTLEVIRETSFMLHRFYEGIGWYAEGLAFFQKSIQALGLNSHDETESALLGRLKAHETGMLLRLGRIPEALSSAQEAVSRLARHEDAPDMLAFALNSLGIAQLYTGDMKTAQATLEQCATIYRQLGRDELLKPLVNLGAIYTRTGEIENAQAVLQEAYEIAQRIGDHTGGYHITNSLGLSSMLLNDYEQAHLRFEDALILSQRTGFLQGQAITLNNLGDVYTLMGQPEQGREYAEQAVRLARQIQDLRSLTYALTTLTLAQIALKHPDAHISLREALEQAHASTADPLLTTVLYAVGEWYASINQHEEAHIVWKAIAEHPATEMDYRRRAQQHLHKLPIQHAASQTLLELINDGLKNLKRDDK